MPTRPYGNDFLVQTPALDQLQNRVYAEQRQRQLYQQQQNQMLDNEFSRNLAGIRDSDIGDLTQKYGDFKIAYQNMLKQKNGVSPQQQLDVLRKKADVYDVINKSKDRKTWEDAQAKQIMTDTKGIYADDAHDQLLQMRRTPVSKIDEAKDGSLLYQYSMPDLDKELKNAQGVSKDVSITLGQSKTDPLKDDKEVYKVGNTPTQFYANLLQGVVAGNKGRNFTGIVNNKYTDEELQDLQNKYDAKINDPKFIAIYGKPEPLPESATKTDLGRAVAIETMENVVNTPLNPTKKISEINLDRKTAQSQEFQLKKQAIGHQNSLENIRVGAALHGNDPDVINQNIDKIIQTHIENSKGLNGEVPMSSETFKALTGETLTKRSVVKIDDDGNYSYGRREDDGTVTNIKTIPYAEAKAALTKAYKAGLSAKYNSGITKPNLEYSDTQEKGIQNFMKANKLTRSDAVKILKQHGRLK